MGAEQDLKWVRCHGVAEGWGVRRHFRSQKREVGKKI